MNILKFQLETNQNSLFDTFSGTDLFECASDTESDGRNTNKGGPGDVKIVICLFISY